MNHFWLRVLFIAVMVTHCSSAQAGWFDNKKKPTQQVTQKAVAQVEKVMAPANPVPQRTAAVMAQRLEPVAPAAAAAVSSQASQQGKVNFYDVGAGETKSAEELNRGNTERNKKGVRLSDEEMEKVKAEIEEMQKGIKIAREARAATQVVTSTATKPVAMPVIPQKPVLPVIQTGVPSASVKPESFKAINASVASGYKK